MALVAAMCDISKSDLVMSTLFFLPATCGFVCLSDLYIYVAVWLHFSVASQLGTA